MKCCSALAEGVSCMLQNGNQVAMAGTVVEDNMEPEGTNLGHQSKLFLPPSFVVANSY